MTRHYDRCTDPDCIVCRDYREQRTQEALWHVLAYRRNRERDAGQASLATYE